MISLELWETIRIRCIRDGEKIRTVARDLGISANTVRKYLRMNTPPKANIPRRKSCLEPYRFHIDELLRSTPKITAVRIKSWLRQNVDSDLEIGRSALQDFIAKRRLELYPREAFIRAIYGPGEQAQFDFSTMTVVLNGEQTVIQLFVLRLSYSGRFFARASFRCNQAALFNGLLEGYLFFGGLTRTAVFDNATTAVQKILQGRDRQENASFAAFRASLALHVEFAAPAKGNEKGGVEGTHGYIEDNFFRPMPHYDSLDALNIALAEFMEMHLTHIHATRKETIANLFAQEQPTFLPLPKILPRPCLTKYAKANKFAEVRFENDLYSVPSKFAFRHVMLEVYESHLSISVETELVAEHQRGSGKGEYFSDIRHALTLLKRKHRAAPTAAIIAKSSLPQAFFDLYERYQCIDKRRATRNWTVVLEMLTNVSVTVLEAAITQALLCGTDDPAAIALLVQQRQYPRRVPRDLSTLPPRTPAVSPKADLSVYTLASLMEKSL